MALDKNFRPRSYFDDLDPAKGEIEIARIVFQSPAEDLFSIRAVRETGAISYRIVNLEYDDENSGVDCHIKQSSEPLTLQEMIEQIQRSSATFVGLASYWTEDGLIFDVLQAHLDTGSDPEHLKTIVDVQSEFYPQLDDYFEKAICDFVDSIGRDTDRSR